MASHRTRTMLQMEAVECGAVALAIVLDFHGCIVPVEELRSACGITRDGSKAGNMIRAARGYGLVAEGLRCAADGLAKLSMPMIVFWENNHFVVLERIDARTVTINDPAIGPRSMSRAEFDRSYSGIALTFAPGDTFRPRGQRPSLTRALLARFGEEWPTFAVVFGASLLSTIPFILAPNLTGMFSDSLAASDKQKWLPFIAVALVACGLLGGLFSWIQTSHLLRLETKFSMQWSGRFMWHVLQLPISFFDHRYAGDLANRVSLNDRLAGAAAMSQAWLGLVNMAIFGLVLCFYSVTLAVIASVFAATNFVIYSVLQRRLADQHRRILVEQSKVAALAARGLKSVREIVASGTETSFLTRVAGRQADLIGARQDMARRQLVLSLMPALMGTLATASVLVIGGLAAMEGALTIGMLVALQGVVASFLAPVTSLVGFGNEVQSMRAEMERVNDVLHHPVIDRPADAPGAETALAGKSAAITLKGVSFRHAPEAPLVLDNISIDILAGSRVAIVGPSGSGKSTLLSLIAGLAEPTSGEILFDGQPRRAIADSRFRRRVALVDQTTVIFEGSVVENLTLWDDSVSLDDVKDAARACAIDERIARLPQGYQSRLSESGGNLSGGERQRLDLARALATQPAVILLDEATSALDQATERAVLAGLDTAATTIAIAHRPESIAHCDRVIEIVDGRIVSDRPGTSAATDTAHDQPDAPAELELQSA